MSYKRPSKLYPPNWHKYRFVIFNRDNYICQRCGVKCRIGGGRRSPHCHHITPIKKGGSHSPENLTTLCEQCHEEVHEEYIKHKYD